ncbi:alpha/beta fold hydrolase [Streptomyces sp. Je 1-369]|uniref:alpha/beta fold hydrolase n=1 Tax=Streptomyces sp. Je 1-369 TaxID=2966192 RepID=UPI00228630ED|nr:alpha/beta hydrolase [Streptomyces sp. Je 1-369]WAL97698.1 alpha/beta hydrolase [Streptomyces sp. Je 1-369]
MSRPPTFVPPPCASARTLRTTRGDFAVLDAVPAAGVLRRGTVLLLPGFTGSKEDFIALLEPLAAAGYRAVTVDGRGQYETPGPDDVSAYAQEELARDVLAQAAALSENTGGNSPATGKNAPAPLHLLGHSLGGQIARAAVLLDPGPFASLTLMSSGPAAIVPVQQTRARMLADALATLSMAEVWQAMRAMEPPPPQEAETGADVEGDADGSEALRARWLLHSPAQLIATGRQLSTEPDRVAELAALPLPKHVISGERDDTWPVPLLDDMARRLDAHRTVIHGAEHSPNTDRPAETAAALIGFWRPTA